MRLSFMDPLVLAIAADEKDVTRRMTAPRCKPGDVIDVCEALMPGTFGIVDTPIVRYRCDGALVTVDRPDGCVWTQLWRWKVHVLPARYCPAWAVRHRREVVSVRPEFLTAVTDDDARREGIARMGVAPTREAFLPLFRKMHKFADDADPIVYRIEFKRRIL